MDSMLGVGPSSALPTSKSVSSREHDDGKKDPTKTANARKRTKTGCLTCRKRRIKCDEIKPTCGNCTKSKRICEGYAQRLVFKPSASQNSYGPSIYPQGVPLTDSMMAQQASTVGLPPFQVIAPKPLSTSSGVQPIVRSQSDLITSDYQPTIPSHSHSNFQVSQMPQLPNPLFLADTSLGMTDPGDNSGGDPFNPAGFPNLPGNQNVQYQLGVGNFGTQDSTLGGDGDMLHQVPYEWFQGTSSLPLMDKGKGIDDSSDDNPDYMADSFILRPEHLGNALTGRFDSSQLLSLFWDEEKKEIFRHFIAVTGPSISLYERRPSIPKKPGLVESDAYLEHNIWSFTFPLVAATNRPLLNTMLALSCLQIAKLKGHEPVQAWKYYHKAVSPLTADLFQPEKRRLVETLAATLLLSYYEVWSSDHTKWCQHLKGARILFKEVPLGETSRIILPVKQMRNVAGIQTAHSGIGECFYSSLSPGNDEHSLNFRLLSTITGSDIAPDRYGLREGQPLHARSLTTTDRDIKDYENRRDLFWWYCKMDVYQSILGGTKLFMEYRHWTQCPPRAPFSNPDAVYGTYDHLILLLGRLASFASGDLRRKRNTNRGRGSPLPFPGMLPAQQKVRAPTGFIPSAERGSPSSDANDEAETTNRDSAIQEWDAIRQAFETFESSLAPGFRPLNREFEDHRETPFGPALQYRSYAIAGIWLNYYMGLICLHRSHPDMPPAAMVAARIVGSTTEPFARHIGRISAGLAGDLSQVSGITTMLSAALVESAFCLFVAAIQFQEPNQRGWVLMRMSDISRLTGWQSARQVALGCESAWAKAAQLGHGPPFVRPPNLNEDPAWIWQHPRRIDQHIAQMNHGEQQIVLHAEDQASYALGLLGVEQDLRVLELNE